MLHKLGRNLILRVRTHFNMSVLNPCLTLTLQALTGLGTCSGFNQTSALSKRSKIPDHFGKAFQGTLWSNGKLFCCLEFVDITAARI